MAAPSVYEAHKAVLEEFEPSVVLDRGGRRQAQKLMIISQDYLRTRLERFVLARSDEAIALSYCNDPTPLSLLRRVCIGDGEGKVVRRGGVSAEYLIQRVWAVDAKGQCSVLFHGLILKELEAKRGELKEAAPSKDNFTFGVRGGKWTAEMHGVAYDSYRCSAKTALGKEMLHRYGKQQSLTFAIAKFGEEVAMLACTYWCSKMEHWLQVWLANGKGTYVFTDEDLAGFQEPQAFTAALATVSEPGRRRLVELQQLKPKQGA